MNHMNYSNGAFLKFDVTILAVVTMNCKENIDFYIFH